MPQHLFSYGTLQPGFAPPAIEPLVRQFHPLGRAWVPGILYDFGEFPGAILRQSEGDKVWGQLFAMPGDPNFLRQLDIYEGFDPLSSARSQFVRVECLATLESGKAIAASIYVYNRPTLAAPRIAGGNYAAVRNSRNF